MTGTRSRRPAIKNILLRKKEDRQTDRQTDRERERERERVRE